MRKSPILGTLLLIPAIGLFSMIGCTKTADKEKPVDTAKKDNNDQKVTDTKKKTEIDKPTVATVKGMVKVKGDVPKQEIDERIAKHKTDSGFCLSGPEIDKQKQLWIVGEKGGVADVVISLEPPEGSSFKMTDELKSAFKHEKDMDQPFCNYRPHVVAVLADIEPVVFRNSAKIAHNVNVQGGNVNGDFVQIVSPGKSTEPRTFKYTKEPINVSCNMHEWMSAKIFVFRHPYFAVSKEKDGTFEIKNVPIDTELTVYMWHESTSKKVEQRKMTFQKGDNELNLEIAAK